MKKRGMLFAGIWLAGAIFVSGGGARALLVGNQSTPSVVNAGKDTTSGDIQKRINEVSRQKQSAEAEKQKLEKEMEEIEEKKSDVVDYIETLDGKLSELEDKITKNEKSIKKVQVEIRKLREEKREAEAARERQYDTMTKRIKYMYENGGESYLELLLEAGSLSELFNRVEYVNKVTDYDKNMLSNYQNVCKKLQQAKKKLERNLKDLTNLKKSLKVEKDSVDNLMDKKTERLTHYKELLKNKSSAVESADNLIQKQEDELEALLEEQRKKIEQEERARAEEQKNADSKVPSDSVGQKVNGGFHWPLPVAGRISSYFGYRTSPTAGASSYHKGIDIAVPVGTSVLAAKAGTVMTATYSASAGRFVGIYHGNGIYSYYMHCSKLSVSVGEKVSQGQQIALSGNTGVSTGPHLHFAIYENGAYVNPLNYVSQ